MNTLRFLAGALVFILYLVPMVILGGAITWGEPLSKAIPITLGGLIFFSSGYILIAAYGDRVIRSIKLRIAAAILLVFPISFTGEPLLMLKHLETWSLMLPINLFSLMLFSAFIWPAWLRRDGVSANGNPD
jgi:hypothetical protein